MTLLLFLLLNTADTTVKQPQVAKHDPSRACGSYVEIKDPKQRRKYKRENRREGRALKLKS